MGHLARLRAAALFLTLCGALCLAPISGSADDDPVAWGYQLANDLMSPFCPGRTLSQCPSPEAAELRQWIILQAAAGAKREEVEAQLIERYGAEILQIPEAKGWGAPAFAVPVLFFLGGGGLVLVLIRRMSKPASAPPPPAPSAGSPGAGAPPPANDAELERLVDEELERLEA